MNVAQTQVEMNRRLWLLLGLGVLVVVGGITAVVLLTRALTPPGYHGTSFQPTEPIADFTLTAHTGQPVSLSDFRGKIVVLYFGYTYCPDVCPATMHELARAMRQLSPAQQEQIQVAMISVDPERDTPEVLANYMDYFNPAFLGLTGAEAQLAAATTPLGIYYEREEGTVQSGYLINHTASVVVLDKEGHLRLLYPFDTPGEAIAADLRQLLRKN